MLLVLGARSPLISVVYHSAAVPGLSSFDVDEILTASRVRNRADAVTGMLLTENGRFLQALEGPEPAVRALMDRILEDPRHEHVRVLVEEVVPTRRFPDWAMAHGHVGEIESAPLAVWMEALQEARDELPDPVSRLERVRTWLRARPVVSPAP